MNKDDRLLELTDRLIDGQLSPSETAELESLALSDETLRELYVEHLHLHGALHFSAVATGEAPSKPTSSAYAEPKKRWWGAIGAAAAAGVILASIVSVQVRAPTDGDQVGVLAQTQSCRWGECTIPTAAGSALRPGTLDLTEGLAVLRFASGAEVALEGPAVVEIQSSMRCRLVAGSLVADIPPSAHGFTIDTATSEVIDYGTRFGMAVVGDASETVVQVFEGEVDVRPRQTGTTRRLKVGERARVSETVLVAENIDSNPEALLRVAPSPADTSQRISIPSSAGNGADVYVQSSNSDHHSSDILLLVKHTDSDKYQRKAYLRFDLTDTKGGGFENATIHLTAAPSGYGFASGTSDCEFSVYGLADGFLEDWDSRSLTWDNAPGFDPKGNGIDLSHASKVASFVLPRGVQSGKVTIEDSRLAEFLNRDTNGVVTFVVVRETWEKELVGDLVHGFANSTHPSLPGPRLSVELQ